MVGWKLSHTERKCVYEIGDLKSSVKKGNYNKKSERGKYISAAGNGMTRQKKNKNTERQVRELRVKINDKKIKGLPTERKYIGEQKDFPIIGLCFNAQILLYFKNVRIVFLILYLFL